MTKKQRLAYDVHWQQMRAILEAREDARVEKEKELLRDNEEEVVLPEEDIYFDLMEATYTYLSTSTVGATAA